MFLDYTKNLEQYSYILKFNRKGVFFLLTVIKTKLSTTATLGTRRAKSGNFVRKKSGQRSAIDEEVFVVFLSCCLRFAIGGRLLEHSKKNDVTVCVLFRGMCHIK